MFMHRSPRLAAALAASCCLAGGLAVALGSGAAAQSDHRDAAPVPPAVQMVTGVTPEEGDAQLATGTARGASSQKARIASMSSPFIAGVPHVPSTAALSIAPNGSAFYHGPGGSVFNGPADEVDAAVDAWWAEQMAAGVSPEQADEKLESLQK